MSHAMPPPGHYPPQWQPQTATPPPPKRKRRWWLIGAAALAVLAFLGILADAAGGNDPDPAATTPPSPTETQTWAVKPGPAPAAAPEQDDAGGSTVVYEVIGKGTASVTYMKEGFAQEQQITAKLPFKKELRFADEVGSFAPISLVAQHSGGRGNITCRVTVDGKVVAENTSSGDYAVVTCTGKG